MDGKDGRQGETERRDRDGTNSHRKPPQRCHLPSPDLTRRVVRAGAYCRCSILRAASCDRLMPAGLWTAADPRGMSDLDTPHSELSDRERVIAGMFAQGMTYRAISDALFIAPTTVRTHLSTIYRKLGVGTKVALA